jgi:hypothetical protein
MSTYAYDTRVTPRTDGTWEVTDGPLAYTVDPSGDGWVAHTSDGFVVNPRPAEFDTVVRSLIGGPR